MCTYSCRPYSKISRQWIPIRIPIQSCAIYLDPPFSIHQVSFKLGFWHFCDAHPTGNPFMISRWVETGLKDRPRKWNASGVELYHKGIPVFLRLTRSNKVLKGTTWLFDCQTTNIHPYHCDSIEASATELPLETLIFLAIYLKYQSRWYPSK